MILTATEFLDRVNRATVAAMEVLAVDKTEMTAAEYMLLDATIATAIRSAYLEPIQIKECFTGPGAFVDGGFQPYTQAVVPAG